MLLLTGDCFHRQWSKWKTICGPGSLSKSACGGDVGPGTGIQLSQGPRKGRLLFIGHYGAYGHDVKDPQNPTHSQFCVSIT